MFVGLFPAMAIFLTTFALAVVFLIVVPNLKATSVSRFIIYSLLLFIPSCMIIQGVVDHWTRRGEFKTAAELLRRRNIELPPSATDIVLYDYSSVYYVAFTAKTDNLHDWIETSLNSPSEPVSNSSLIPTEVTERLNRDRFRNRFQKTDFRYQSGMIEISPERRDGGVTTIWHSQESGKTFMLVTSF